MLRRLLNNEETADATRTMIWVFAGAGGDDIILSRYLLEQYELETKMKDKSVEELADLFSAWMQDQDRTNNDTDNLLKFYFKYLFPNYKKYLALAQAVAAKGYYTATDIPISERAFNKYLQLDAFAEWLQNRNIKEKDVDFKVLLAWYTQHATKSSHADFLELAQAAADRGYKTAIDVPFDEAEYTKFKMQYIYGKYIYRKLDVLLKNNKIDVNVNDQINQKIYSSFTAPILFRSSNPVTVKSKDINIEIENNFRI